MVTLTDTICAIATPPGRGGVGIIRLCGNNALQIAKQIAPKVSFKPRMAHFAKFVDKENQLLDEGVAIYFKGPHSFTGEDVVELQGHGGPVILDLLLSACLAQGARVARPGEFSERAFLNGKLDLAQAEAIADLIDASSQAAARSAVRTLQGEFSTQVNQLVEKLIYLRMYVESAIDFPEEEIDFLSDGKVKSLLEGLEAQFNAVMKHAKQGRLLNEGVTLALAGKPNAGKSSLLNALTEQESAIVTDIPGTTRDIIRENIILDGMALNVVDTAGLRESEEAIEQEGIKRARAAIEQADCIVVVVDCNRANDLDELLPELEPSIPRLVVFNKVDLLQGELPSLEGETQCAVSAKLGDGLDSFKATLKQLIGVETKSEGCFIARRRHLHALEQAFGALLHAKHCLLELNAGELVAEELKIAQNELNSITGEFTSDDLLGEIFSNFCIGK